MRAGRQRTAQVLGSVLFFAVVGTAQGESCEKSVGRLVSLQGTVEARPSNQTVWQAAKLNDKFCPGDAIRTGARSRAAMVLANETIVRLDQLTTLTLSGLDDTSTSWIDLLSGMAHFLSRTPRSLKVKTPYINAGVEGTEFVVRAGRNEGSVSVLEGRVLAENAQGSATLVSGESAAASAGQAPLKRLEAQIRGAVQWSLYYPPLFEGSTLVGNESWAEASRRSAAAYLAGDSAAAFAAIASVPDSVTDARFFNYRAGLLLSVGRVDEAQADISRSLQLSADNAHALALQSVLAVARGDASTALDLARKANSRDPASVSAWAALSYAQQAVFDLDGARASMQQAVLNDPANVLAWARLAELWLAQGDLEQAQDAADRAVSINANIARTQTVRGFASLTRIKTAAAQRAFERAISQDSADPLARLGLGLVLIRQGYLEDGRREIEIAAALDPNNALIRSYLGKAYYEEKRNRLARTQLDMAKQLDPKDPTPWFYDAIRKQTENRPVEALQDLHKSIELNNNRAVYRSRLLLDQDLAARSTSLARIYQDLGFSQRAMVEGWHSVNSDPSNYSAHRFLSDVYASRPRHNIARASELLQAQLLQPLNLNSLQPQMMESGAYVPSGLLAGPSAAGFNEYNSLFTRDRLTGQVSGLVGSNETFGAEAVVSGLTNIVSYSVGSFSYNSDGFRPNNYLDQTVYSGHVQVAISPRLNMQAEARSLSRENGDLRRMFDPMAFSGVRTEELDTESLRFGLRYQLSPVSDLIVSLQSQGRDSRVYDSVNTSSTTTTTSITTDSTGDTKNTLSEIQHLHRSSIFNIVTGAGYFDGAVDNQITGSRTTCLVLPPLCLPTVPINSVDMTDTRHTTAYSYVNIRTSPEWVWTLGLSADSISNNVIDESRVNPKLGLIWAPEQMTTVRAAAFRATKRDLVTDQTIEPTQVAGFNQFYDDQNSTDTWHYGAGLDHRASGLFSGLEYFKRDMEVPKKDASSGIVSFPTWNEQHGRAYLYWTIGPKSVATAEYLYELTKRPEASTPDGILTLRTHRAPIGLRFFYPSGIIWNIQATYLNQNGSFVDTTKNPKVYTDGNEQVWLIDTELNYRLPKRYGFIALGVKNIFDTEFKFQDIAPANPIFGYNRFVYGRMILTF